MTATCLQSLWKPKNLNTHMTAFTEFVCRKYGNSFDNYHQLYEWSCLHIEEFWASVWDYTTIRYSKTYSKVIEQVPMDHIPKWFFDARLNFAENLLIYNDDMIALIATGESGYEKKMTYAELYHQVASCAFALRQVGVGVGDRVVGYISNCIEAVVGMLAATSIGAIWSSTSPDFGFTGVLDRFTQIEPKVLFTVNAVVYNGKVHDHLHKVKQVVQDLKSLKCVVMIPFVADHPTQVENCENCVLYGAFLSKGMNATLEFEQLPFSHPAFILYSSGTTGKPKCIVHSAGGVLIQHKKEHVIHGNMTRDDVFLQYTTTGWMMWNWLVSALSVGCTLVLFDGSPFHADPLLLWKLVDKYKITKFGTSAKYIQSLESLKVEPSLHCSLLSLDSIYSTGSPLKPESFDFVYKSIKQDVLLGSITGGTDIVSLFAGHNTNLPVYRGEIQCRCLGMAVQAWIDEKKPVFGESADLVCTKPFPCMPVYFWNDNDGRKYQYAYFDRFPGVWYHGDFVMIQPETKGLIMLGRSDGTLKPGGVRFGSAEIYNIVAECAQVEDSLCVGQQWKDDERVVLFLKMRDDSVFSEELVKIIKTHIRNELSPRHVPSFILQTPAIPYTINGKKVEVAVKKIISGETVVASGTLANPESLDFYYNIPELMK